MAADQKAFKLQVLGGYKTHPFGKFQGLSVGFFGDNESKGCSVFGQVIMVLEI